MTKKSGYEEVGAEAVAGGGGGVGALGREVELDRSEVERLVEGRHPDPHSVLGRHGGRVRAFRPGASEMYLLVTGSGPGAPGSGPGAPVLRRTPMRQAHPAGLWEAPLVASAEGYRLEAIYGRAGAPGFVFDDPYRHWPTLGELDLYLFNEGRHRRLWEVLGAHPREHEGVMGTAFAVWAPNAKAVRVVGDWNFWDGRVHPMRTMGSSGVWELFVPGVEAGARYKYEIVGADERLMLKADPMAFATEMPPGTASVVASPPAHDWQDGVWMDERAKADELAKPMSIYEVHLGSWRWGGGQASGSRPLTYLELAEQLPEYVASMGFTHVEFLPVAEHPFGGSWGYQVSAYYAPTARFGSPDDFRVLVDALHRRGIGVIVDWVPAHFPRDEWALAHFDGTALYEHSGAMGAHPDWGTLVFNVGRHEVRNFLTANALFWAEEFHIDGLRVDAVASMLYLDYSRQAGEWVPNKFGGNENLESVDFLKETNELVFSLCPGVTTIAEESTAWPAVSRPTYLGGLGFGFKWNMGWMHDTLRYFEVDSLFRRYHQNDLTFGLIYAWHENFILPLSHDEVVHGKRSLLAKMPGDRWQQLANLRALYAWMWAHPGKKLLFMGGELGEEPEWSADRPLDWWILDEWADHAKLQRLVAELNRVYRAEPALWEEDFNPSGFRWIDASDADHNVLSFYRSRRVPGHTAGGSRQASSAWTGESPARNRADEGPARTSPDGVPPRPDGVPPPADVVACVANFSPVPQLGYRVGLPRPGRWAELVNTDATEWGGSGLGNMGVVNATEQGWHGQPCSAEMLLPPLGVLWLAPAP
ncbi:MAG: 1,4-alpha-glucan branching protein GlgB [Actinomycetota bacterium]|jgi:1,4-alpha-glucan branching enzyme|nr:1,4-alpha-glucan branching protein GlgB [Actinomycetota bacterium]